MSKEAKQFEEQDNKKKEEVEIINQADTLLYSTEKTLKDMEGKVGKDKLDKIKKEMDELKKMLEIDKKDTAKIKAKLDEAMKVIQEASVELYQKAGPQGPIPGAQEAKQSSKSKKSSDEDEEVVDADFKVEDEN
jgi:molecular chaperone DnaK